MTSMNIELLPEEFSLRGRSPTVGSKSKTSRISTGFDDLIVKVKRTRAIILSSISSSIGPACLLATLTIISIIIGILTVCLTSRKTPDRSCNFILKSEALNSMSVDSHPHSIAVGDFNNDGLLDLVVPNSGTNRIGVFLRDTNNTFKDQMTYPTDPHSIPYSVTVADFNHDQRLDIAVANFGTNRIGIFLGFGNGTFHSQTTFSTQSSRPRWIATGDFNRDGRIDLAVVSDTTNSIGILLGDGHGNFANWTTFSTGFDSTPYSLAAVDVNHDERLDLIVANFGTQNVGLLLGHGNGSFTDQITFDIGRNSQPCAVTVADLNNDTHRDIIVVSSNTNTIAVLFGFGNGRFSSPTEYSTGDYSSPRSVVVGDFDNDSRVDIAVGTYSNSRVSLFLGHGNGTFSDQILFYTSSDSQPFAMTSGYFNNDTRLDIAVVNFDYNYIDIVLTYRNYSFCTPLTYRTAAVRSNRQPDFNNDGQVDTLGDNSSSSNLGSILRVPTSNYVQSKGNIAAGKSIPQSILVRDFNNDNRLDILFSNQQVDNLQIFYGDGHGSFINQAIYSTGMNSTPSAIALGDLNNDSRLDLIVVNSGRKNIGVFLGNSNGKFSNQITYSTGEGSQPSAVDVGDLNADGRLDLVVISQGRQGIAIFFGDGNGSFSSEQIYSTGRESNPVWVHIADLNNDKRMDIAVVDETLGHVGVFFGGIFTYEIVFSVGIAAGSNGAAIADLNADGRMDIVVNIHYNRAFEVLLGHGNGTFWSKARYSVGSRARPNFSTIADWNNDQRLDIIISSCDTDNILVFLGYGDGTFLPEQIYSTGKNSCPLASTAGDLNHDGLLDIVVVNSNTNTIGVFLAYTYMNGIREATYSTGSASHPHAIALDHFSNDNPQLGIVLANHGLGNVGFLRGYPNGSFPLQKMFPTGTLSFPTSIAIDDLNADHQQDIIVTNSLAGNLGILYGYGNGNFSSQQVYSTGYNSLPQSLITADFNNDKRVDIAVVSSGSRSVSILLRFNTVIFPKRYEYPVGRHFYPHGVAVGDFNNDQHPDFVTINRGGESISIFLGLDDGTFSGPRYYQAGQGSPSYGIAVGHFNNDSYLDIVVTHYWSDCISLFLGCGDGTFFNASISSTVKSCRPIGIAVGDFNHDNRLDAVVGCDIDSSIGIFIGCGNGTFENVVSYPTGMNTNSVYAAVADFNNDTHSDIVVTSPWSSSVIIFQGYGNGTFFTAGSCSTGSLSQPRPVATADLDEDGHMDIVVGNSGSDNICVLFGYGNSSFAPAMFYPIDTGSLTYGLIIRDLNNDGQLDIAVACYGANQITILLRLTNRLFFNPLMYSTGYYSQPSYLAVADFNNDSRLDIVVANSGIDSVVVFLGNASEDFLTAPAYTIDSSPKLMSIAVGDFDDDRHLDIVVADNATNEIIIVYGSGYGTFTRHMNYSTGNDSHPCSVAVADLNKDNRLDIVVASSGADMIAVFLADTNGTFRSPVVYSTGDGSQPYAVAVGDFDNDTRLDIAVGNYAASSLGVFLGYGNGSFAEQRSFNTGFGSHPFALAVGDVNNDNITDIVATNNGYGNIDILMKTC